LLIVVLGLGWAQPASAQTVRTILQVPVNFRNDTSQPRTLVQLKADGDTVYAKMLADSYYGAVTATTTVLPYLTLPMDKGCVKDRGVLPVMDMTAFYKNIDAGLVARGQPTWSVLRSQYTYAYIVSPTTFRQCSHDDQLGLAIDSPISASDHLTRLTWRLGLPLAIDWACRAAAGSSTYVTLSAFCGPSLATAGGRNTTSHAGQGAGSLSAWERHRIGGLPVAQQVTVVTTKGQWTLTRLENWAAGVKRLLIPAMGIELEYHAPLTTRNWDSRGVTGHLLNTSKRLDFTPDGKWVFGTTALEPHASWVYNNLRLTVLSADLDVAVVDLRPASDPAPTPPAGPRCATTSQDPSINVIALTDGACGTWKIDRSRRVFRGGFFAGYADSITFCNGVVYVQEGTLWRRYASGASGAVMVPLNTPATPTCNTSPLPPPPPPEAAALKPLPRIPWLCAAKALCLK
jgi:hypothetical protein